MRSAEDQCPQGPPGPDAGPSPHIVPGAEARGFAQNADTSAVGSISREQDAFVFRSPGYDLVVRGRHPEWVLRAAADVIRQLERLEAQGRIEDMRPGYARQRAQADCDARFDGLTTCTVRSGSLEYTWAAGPDPLQKNEV